MNATRRTISRRRTNHSRTARALWAGARGISGTAGERYLLGRSLSDSCRDLRFHPNTPLGRGTDVVFRPALLAAVSNDAGVIAVQRIFLDPARPTLAPDVDPPRRMLGRPLDGAVRLAAAGETLGLAEGVETALSASAMLHRRARQ